MRALLLAPLLIASTAYAQAPGDTMYAPPPMYAQPPPAVVVPAPSGDWAVMQNRLSIGLNVGQTTITDNAQNKTDFSIGELALRYRLRPEWEAELLIGGGNEKLADGTQGTHQFTSATLGLRYRFRPADQLNWFLAAGVGASAVTDQNATSDQQDAATRPHFQFGGGVEYRFAHFALQAELRVTAMGQPKGTTDTPGTAMPTLTNADPSQTQTATAPQDTMTAGQVTIGASYYF